MKKHVAEIVSFRLQNKVSPEEFVSISQESENFVRSHGGFIARQLSQGADGLWTDYVVWESMDLAKKAAELFPKQAFAPKLMSAIDEKSIVMRHEEILWTMTS